MQTIATFFAGIMALFSSLLGNTTIPQPPKTEPVVITSPVSATSVAQVVASTTTPVAQPIVVPVPLAIVPVQVKDIAVTVRVPKDCIECLPFHHLLNALKVVSYSAS